MVLYDISAGLISSFIISPIMTSIDISIIQSQIKHKPFVESFKLTNLQLYSGKLPFIKPFGIMNFVYSATYLSANLTDYYCKKYDIDSKVPVLFNTSIVNVAAIAYKDIAYSKLFHSPEQQKVQLKTTHWNSYGLFALRDIFTISASFVLKKDFNEFLTKRFHLSTHVADLVSSFTLPVAAQLISTPIHILSIDLMQQPNQTIQQRIEHIKRIYWNVCLGRMLRVIPAFGIGGFLNDMIRENS